MCVMYFFVLFCFFLPDSILITLLLLLKDNTGSVYDGAVESERTVYSSSLHVLPEHWATKYPETWLRIGWFTLCLA